MSTDTITLTELELNDLATALRCYLAVGMPAADALVVAIGTVLEAGIADALNRHH